MRHAEPDECRQDEVEKRVRGALFVIWLTPASFRKRDAMATYGSWAKCQYLRDSEMGLG